MGIVSRKTECALLAAMDLAAHYERGKLVTTGDVAHRTRVSRKYLGQVLLLLKRRMLVRSTRGVEGGYALMRRPELISVAEVIDAVTPAGRRVAPPAAGRPYGDALNWLARRTAEARRGVLANVTLADLVNKALPQE